MPIFAIISCSPAANFLPKIFCSFCTVFPEEAIVPWPPYSGASACVSMIAHTGRNRFSDPDSDRHLAGDAYVHRWFPIPGPSKNSKFLYFVDRRYFFGRTDGNFSDGQKCFGRMGGKLSAGRKNFGLTVGKFSDGRKIFGRMEIKLALRACVDLKNLVSNWPCRLASTSKV